MMSTITDNHFEIFAEECRFWISRFNFSDWEIDIVLLKNEDNCEEGTVAECDSDVSNKSASLILYQEWKNVKEIKESQLKETAKHEVLELLLTELDYFCKRDLHSTKKFIEINRTRHSVINRLMKVL